MSSGFEPEDPQPESSRLQPVTDSARNGVIDSLRTRHPVYSAPLAWLRRPANASPLLAWGLALGGFFMQRTLGGFADAAANSTSAFLLYGVFLLYVLMTILVWLARPLLNSLLRFHSAGRRVVSAHEIRESNWIGGYLAGALLCLVLSFVPDWDLLQIPALCLVLSAMPLQLIFRLQRGPARTVMVTVVAALAMLTIMWPAAVRTGEPDLERQFILWFWGLLVGAIALGPLMLRRRSQA